MRRRRRGSVAVEYGLLVGLVAVILLAALLTTGHALQSLLERAGQALNLTPGPAPAVTVMEAPPDEIAPKPPAEEIAPPPPEAGNPIIMMGLRRKPAQ